jgi:1-acyl-sn-glycerol-3-phosphate acyltransferase
VKSIRQWLGSVVFTIYLFVSVAAFAAVVFVAAIGSRSAAYSVARAWARAALSALRVLCGLDYRLEGRERIGTESCVVLMKHSSAWETIAQLVIFPRQCWVMKRELLWVPILGWVLRLFSPIAINRKGGRAAVEQVVSQGKDRLERGYWVMIFPEGTRVPIGEKRRYGISGALLAAAAGKPILPVAHNAGAYWPRRGWLKRPGTIRMSIGPPIDSANRDTRELTTEVERWIDTTIATFGAPDGSQDHRSIAAAARRPGP